MLNSLLLGYPILLAGHLVHRNRYHIIYYLQKDIQFYLASLFAAPDHISAYENLAGKLSKVYDECIMKVEIRRRKPHNNWTDGNILKLYCEKERKWKECQKHPRDTTPEDEYHNLRKDWELVNEMIGKPKNQSSDDTIKMNFWECDTQTLANDFNKTFTNTIHKLTGKILKSGGSSELPLNSSSSEYLP